MMKFSGKVSLWFLLYKNEKIMKLSDNKILEQNHKQDNDMLFPVYIQSAVY